MPSTEPPAITELLRAAGQGERDAVDALFARVYGELHEVAERVLGRGAGETLSPTVLVHEAYLKLVPASSAGWKSREHFFRTAARAMRQIVLNAAKARRAQKRGGGGIAVTLGDSAGAVALPAAELVALDAALERLGALDPRAAEIVELRFFAGLGVEETAAILGISAPTVKRSWRASRAWLLSEIADADHA
jgi:RNA polymerase sigma factor (TIGR02999 family)